MTVRSRPLTARHHCVALSLRTGTSAAIPDSRGPMPRAPSAGNRAAPEREAVMAATLEAPAGGLPVEQVLERQWERRPGLLGWFTTVDHKEIGIRYTVTAFVF